MKDYRRPFALVSKEIPEEEQLSKIRYEIQYHLYGKIIGSYTFKAIDSNLLIDIDNNNAIGVANALKKEKIDINNLYFIPPWEVPKARKPQFQTFLHRALWKHSPDVFKLLLQKGANPRIKGHRNSTVIDDLFDGNTNGENIFKFGKMLVDAGVKPEEFKKRVKALERMKKYKPYVQKITRNTFKLGKMLVEGGEEFKKRLEAVVGMKKNKPYSQKIVHLADVGKMWIDAGVISPKEIMKSDEETLKRMKEYKPYVQKLIHYAETKKTKIAHNRKIKTPISNSDRIKD